MNDLVLTLSVRWLPATDALAASCVNTEWHAELSSAENNLVVWKQVSQNTNALVTKGFESHDATDFRRLALSLVKDVKEERTFHTYTPTLDPNQVFCVIELYRNTRQDGKRRIVTEASWTCPLCIHDNPYQTQQFQTDTPVTMRGRNPYSASMVGSEKVQEWQSGNDWESRDYFRPAPYLFSILDIKGSTMARNEVGEELKVKAVLWRRDTMESVCVLDHVIDNWLNPQSYRQEDDHYLERMSGCNPVNPNIFYDRLWLSDNEYGQKAKSMLYDRGRCEIKPVGLLSHKVKLPTDSEDSPWIQNCFQELENNRLYEPGEEDLIALSNIPHFDVEVGFKLSIKTVTTAGGSMDEMTAWDREHDFTSNDNMMVAIEGLLWK